MVIVRPIKTNTLMSSFNAARVVQTRALPRGQERKGEEEGGAGEEKERFPAPMGAGRGGKKRRGGAKETKG